MTRKIRVKRGPKSKLPQLDIAEFGFTTDTEQTFIGNATKNIELAKQTDVNSLTQQLADKAKKSEVRKDTATQPINVSEMDTETKQLFTGGAVAVVGVDAVGKENLKLKAVNPENTSFLDVSLNLFDKNSAVPGGRITTGGTFLADEEWTTGDFITLKSNTNYKRSHNSVLTLYDANKNYVTIFSGGNTPTLTHSLTKYGKLSVRIADLEAFQFEEGSATTEYRSYGVVGFPDLKITTGNLSPVLLGFNNYRTEVFRENSKIASSKVMNGLEVIEESIFNRNAQGKVVNIVFTKGGKTVTTVINRDSNGKYLNEVNTSN